MADPYLDLTDIGEKAVEMIELDKDCRDFFQTIERANIEWFRNNALEPFEKASLPALYVVIASEDIQGTPGATLRHDFRIPITAVGYVQSSTKKDNDLLDRAYYGARIVQTLFAKQIDANQWNGLEAMTVGPPTILIEPPNENANMHKCRFVVTANVLKVIRIN